MSTPSYAISSGLSGLWRWLRDEVEYTETLLFDLFKKLLGSGPVYATMGNHDSYNQ